uniref:Uncharacterized protein n=1 Tax=Arundo donax TaxID=35708 RepID=A0A0A9AP59_ARUDO
MINFVFHLCFSSNGRCFEYLMLTLQACVVHILNISAGPFPFKLHHGPQSSGVLVCKI